MMKLFRRKSKKGEPGTGPPSRSAKPRRSMWQKDRRQRKLRKR